MLFPVVQRLRHEGLRVFDVASRLYGCAVRGPSMHKVSDEEACQKLRELIDRAEHDVVHRSRES